MEFRQLQYAVQIAQERNFSRAAEKLHIAQPSLSQQLSKLEKEIGVLLFRRTTNSVELTHAGEIFVDRAQKIWDAMEQLKSEMADISQTKKGKVVIGTMPITGSHLLPHVLPSFHSIYPDIELVLVEDTSTSNLERMTAQGKNDLCLLSLPLTDPALAWEPLVDEEILLAVPNEHPLLPKSGAPAEAVPLASLQDEPFILLKRGQGFRQLTMDLCEQAGFRPNVVFESSNIETVQSLVAAGMGVALVPAFIARAPRIEFVPAYLPLAGRPARTLVIAYREGRYMSHAASAFIQTLKTAVAKRYGSGSEAP
ncbi:LysR family transcriptional regulator [Paenibacillus melissococcoides]|uniref:LysR family transcriptional regulator n=1 Tax=Paenibacillus melissococcoides TaxID=2912268 RepID=A0ABM9GC63_9BACL|nr:MULTISPECIES: LysR family transcriptional regulator [Paenibacillus]MEB9892101.1 LysR family transcriptional regulator [Bacillus cereus]GIO76750.1 putative HTH-type transcriptional regulator YcgK [Paenibacillus dendritiformis]CAH8249264.1 LysR family transcriptional regulator [Paenibacillus melissococcoides]